MTNDEAANVIGNMVGAFRARDIEDATLAMWADLIQGESYFDARDALKRLVRTRRRMPSIAELLDEIRDVRFERARKFASEEPRMEVPEKIVRNLGNQLPSWGPADDDLHLETRTIAPNRERL